MSAVTGSHHEESDVHELRALGFWIYLMTDALIFALLFATYGVMVGNVAGGPSGRTLFDLDNVAIETALLLVSSITFGFASLSTRAGAPAPVPTAAASCRRSSRWSARTACTSAWAWRGSPSSACRSRSRA
jgi:heme/copper-type cytochrome/quinol oxidase subunit 3